jgi:hypothetical protein
MGLMESEGGHEDATPLILYFTKKPGRLVRSDCAWLLSNKSPCHIFVLT